MARQYWNVLSAGGKWEARKEGSAHGDVFATQLEAIEAARSLASAAHVHTRKPTGIRVQGRDGQWREERSYGDDPNPPKG